VEAQLQLGARTPDVAAADSPAPVHSLARPEGALAVDELLPGAAVLVERDRMEVELAPARIAGE
jgi:hypothetical protein